MPNPQSSQPLTTSLKKWHQKVDRVAVLAIGSPLRGDDGAAGLAVEALEVLAKDSPARSRLGVFNGETAPENFTGEIRRFAPSHLIIIDAAELAEPGLIELIEPAAIASNSPASTHRMPMNVLTDYLRVSIGCQVLIIGIGAASRTFGHAPCQAVKDAAQTVADAIAQSVL
ncbi:MAG: hydrogenase 3 maturation endopeptidase HyCI [Phycisphaerae bacterium]|jgi:hydrogenase 3 maturation protease